MKRGGGGGTGNREGSQNEIFRLRAHLRGARAGACLEKEGGLWGKHGFPHATEAEEAA